MTFDIDVDFGPDTETTVKLLSVNPAVIAIRLDEDLTGTLSIALPAQIVEDLLAAVGRAGVLP